MGSVNYEVVFKREEMRLFPNLSHLSTLVEIDRKDKKELFIKTAREKWGLTYLNETHFENQMKLLQSIHLIQKLHNVKKDLKRSEDSMLMLFSKEERQQKIRNINDWLRTNIYVFNPNNKIISKDKWRHTYRNIERGVFYYHINDKKFLRSFNNMKTWTKKQITDFTHQSGFKTYPSLRKDKLIKNYFLEIKCDYNYLNY